MLKTAHSALAPAVRIALSALIFLAATLPFPLVASASHADHGTLVVSARAEVKAAPDMAKFDVGVETRAQTVEEARDLNAEAMERVRNALFEAGATPDALQTANFYVYPEWHYDSDTGDRRLIGYRIVHTLTVTVTDLDRLGALLDAALSVGANQVSSPTFGLINPEQLEAQALREAVRKARAKAEILAEASGTFLKGVIHISEQVASPIAMPMVAAYSVRDALMEKAATEISPGEVTVTATVSVTYEI